MNRFVRPRKLSPAVSTMDWRALGWRALCWRVLAAPAALALAACSAPDSVNTAVARPAALIRPAALRPVGVEQPVGATFSVSPRSRAVVRAPRVKSAMCGALFPLA